MGDVRTFEDLKIWQMGRKLSNTVYGFTRQEAFSRDYGLKDQLRRSSVSVMTNIAEGFERGSNKDFIRFLFIARGSAGEARSLLFVALDQGYITEEEAKEAQELCREASYGIWGLIKSLRKRLGWVTGTAAMFLGFLCALAVRFR